MTMRTVSGVIPVVPGPAKTSPGESPRSIEGERPSAAACKERLCAVLHSEKGAAQCFAKEEHAERFADLLRHYGIDLMKSGDEESVIRFHRQHRGYLLPNASGLTSFLDGRDAQGTGLVDVAILRGDKELVRKLLWDDVVSLTTSSPGVQSEAGQLIAVAARFLSPTRSDADLREFHGLIVEGLSQGYLGAERPKSIDTLTLVIDTVQDPEMQSLVFEATWIRGQIDRINRWGETPLTHACKSGRLDCASSLLNHGADPSSKNEKGQTAMDIAKARGDGKLVALIEGAIAERQAATDDDDIAF